MNEERDTRTETLRAGDCVRYMGTWLDIVKVREGVDRFGPTVVFDCEDANGTGRTVFYRRGIFVAANCMPRVDA